VGRHPGDGRCFRNAARRDVPGIGRRGWPGFGTALLPRDRSAALELSWRAARDSDPAARQQAAQVMSETGAESSHSTASLFAKQSQFRRSLRLPAAGDSDPAVRQRPAQAMSETGAGSSHSTAIAFCKTKPISARSLRPLAARDSDSAVRQRPAQAMSENGAGSSHSTASLFAKQSQSRQEARDRSAPLELSRLAARDSDSAARQQAAQAMSENGAAIITFNGVAFCKTKPIPARSHKCPAASRRSTTHLRLLGSARTIPAARTDEAVVFAKQSHPPTADR